MPCFRVAALLAVALTLLALNACGEKSSSQSTTARSPIGLQTCTKLIEASLEIDKGESLTGRLESRPRDISKAKQVLKPLTIANALDVNESNEVAGATVSALLDQLDELYPGMLTKETSQGEELDAPVVNRFLRYARTRPRLVAEPRVARAIERLDSRLHGKRADLDLSSCGGGLTTAEDLVIDEQARAQRFWPALAKKLDALHASLR